jgi:hypothetical protein
MATQTLMTNQTVNPQGSPPYPSGPVVNIGSPVTHVDFSVTTSPGTAFAEISILWGTDGVNFPGQHVLYSSPGSPQTDTATQRQPGAQYFQAFLTKASPQSAVTVTMSY